MFCSLLLISSWYQSDMFATMEKVYLLIASLKTLILTFFLLLLPGIIAIAEINEALNSGDHQQTLAALLLPTAKLTGVNPATAKHYHDVLQHTKRLLCQVMSQKCCMHR